MDAVCSRVPNLCLFFLLLLYDTQLLDTCLRLGSKDNMTALVVKFIGQTVAQEGGGVAERRRQRELLEVVDDESDDEGIFPHNMRALAPPPADYRPNIMNIPTDSPFDESDDDENPDLSS